VFATSGENACFDEERERVKAELLALEHAHEESVLTFEEKYAIRCKDEGDEVHARRGKGGRRSAEEAAAVRRRRAAWKTLRSTLRGEREAFASALDGDVYRLRMLDELILEHCADLNARSTLPSK